MIQRNDNTSEEATTAEQTACPTCGVSVLVTSPTHPFCSKRCRQIDLGKWLDGSYTISRPIEQSDLEEGVD